jgi:uncharacterized protein YegP (UPF0339 family)
VGDQEVQARGPSSAKEETVTNVRLIEVYEDSEGEWRWRGVAGNGEIVCQGESHTTVHDAKRAAMDVIPGILIKEVEDDGGEG